MIDCQFFEASKTQNVFYCRDINNAVEEYYTKGYGTEAASAGSGSFTQAKAQQTFDRYKDAGTGNIEIDGLQKFFEDLGVNAATDIVTMLISMKMGAANMGIYTSAEFVNGFKALGVGSVDDLKKKLPQLYQDLKN